MNDAAAPYGRKTQRAPKIAEVHVLWITAGLGCDGDSGVDHGRQRAQH